MNPHDEFISTEHRYSLGVDRQSGRRYASIPVSNGLVDYEEYYALSGSEYALFLADSSAALTFIEQCRRREHDDLLMQQPG